MAVALDDLARVELAERRSSFLAVRTKLVEVWEGSLLAVVAALATQQIIYIYIYIYIYV